MRRNAWAAALLAALVCLARPGLAADGDLDRSFADLGTATVHFGNLYNVAYDLARQGNDGKLVLVGYTGTADPFTATTRFAFGGGPVFADLAVARLGSDGALDADFADSGRFTLALGQREPGRNSGGILTAVSILDDGKILAAGYNYFWGSGNYIVLLRLRPDGQLDTTFGVGGLVYQGLTASCPFDSKVYDMKVEQSGRILLAGVGSPGGGAQGLLVRFESWGALDSSFHGGQAYSTVEVTSAEGSHLDSQFFAMTLTEEAIYAVGKVESRPGVSGMGDLLVAKFRRADATLDPAFGNGRGYVVVHGPRDDDTSNHDDLGYGIACQGGGPYLIVAGDFGGRPALVRLDPQGQVDTGFGPDGNGFATLPGPSDTIAPSGALTGVRVLSDGSLLAWGWNKTGSGSEPDGMVAGRFDANGRLLEGFGQQGQSVLAYQAQTAWGHAMELSPAPEGYYLAGTVNNGHRMGVSRFLLDLPADEESTAPTGAGRAVTGPLLLLLRSGAPQGGPAQAPTGSRDS